MTLHKLTLRVPLTLTTILMVTSFASTALARAEAPLKLVPTIHIGREVNKTTGKNTCTVESKDECRGGEFGSEVGGFYFPEGVAGAPNGNIYVADSNNQRVQEFTPAGEFVLMFGREVNETKDKAIEASEAEKNVCTEEEIKLADVKCKSGVRGTGQESMMYDQSVATDPSDGNVYVLDSDALRVDEYTPTGRFVLMLGKEVNETEDHTPGASVAAKNICTAESKDACTIGVRVSRESTEEGAFDPENNGGDLLAVGGSSEHILYVGDAHRIEKFNGAGEWKGEIKLPSAVIASAPVRSITALAVDPKTEDVYVDYWYEQTLHEFDGATGQELKNFEIKVRDKGKVAAVYGLAIDQNGHLAVAAQEFVAENTGDQEAFGDLYEASTARLISNFADLETGGMGFINNDELFVANDYIVQEVVGYVLKPVGELVVGAFTCVPGVEHETDVTLACSLHGQVDPWNVPGTEVWFQWGRTSALGSETPKTAVATGETVVPVSSEAAVVRPGEAAFYYRLAGDDVNSPAPELLTSETVSFSTPIVPPKIVGAPSASFVSASSAVLSGELNPENSKTHYEFQYARASACDAIQGCPEVLSTPASESSVYRKLATTGEISGLQPSTTYRVRLVAESENSSNTEKLSSDGEEATFTTEAAPRVGVLTGSASVDGATAATISGTVEPGGQPATYAFELGVYAGAQTQYGIVFSGPVQASLQPVAKSQGLTGLQPGTTYAYRMTISSGYVKNASHTLYGASAAFTTEGLPAVLVAPASLPMLGTPDIAFPQPAKTPTGKAKGKAKKKTKGKPKKKTKSKPKKKTKSKK